MRYLLSWICTNTHTKALIQEFTKFPMTSHIYKFYNFFLRSRSPPPILKRRKSSLSPPPSQHHGGRSPPSPQRVPRGPRTPPHPPRGGSITPPPGITTSDDIDLVLAGALML